LEFSQCLGIVHLIALCLCREDDRPKHYETPETISGTFLNRSGTSRNGDLQFKC
jgi:hypothetical protein